MYIPNPDAARELVESREAKAAVHDIAAEAADLARDRTPVASGAHRAAIYAADDEYGSTSSTWHLIEYGSIHNPAYRPLSSAAETVGLRFEDEGPQ